MIFPFLLCITLYCLHVYLYIYTYIYIYMCVCVCTYVCVYNIHLGSYWSMDMYIMIYSFLPLQSRKFLSQVPLYHYSQSIDMYMVKYMYIYIYLNKYIYTDIHTYPPPLAPILSPHRKASRARWSRRAICQASARPSRWVTPPLSAALSSRNTRPAGRRPASTWSNSLYSSPRLLPAAWWCRWMAGGYYNYGDFMVV